MSNCLPAVFSTKWRAWESQLTTESRPELVARNAFDRLFDQWGSLMAGSLLGSVPVAIIYSFFVEYYVSSMTGAVKE